MTRRKNTNITTITMNTTNIITKITSTKKAITIIITGVYRNSGADGVQMTAQALKTVAPWFSSLLTLAVVLFAFSTMLSYSFYGKKAVGYLFGNSTTAERI